MVSPLKDRTLKKSTISLNKKTEVKNETFFEVNVGNFNPEECDMIPPKKGVQHYNDDGISTKRDPLPERTKAQQKRDRRTVRRQATNDYEREMNELLATIIEQNRVQAKRVFYRLDGINSRCSYQTSPTISIYNQRPHAKSQTEHTIYLRVTQCTATKVHTNSNHNYKNN